MRMRCREKTRNTRAERKDKSTVTEKKSDPAKGGTSWRYDNENIWERNQENDVCILWYHVRKGERSNCSQPDNGMQMAASRRGVVWNWTSCSYEEWQRWWDFSWTGSWAEEREISGKPILTVHKYYICTKNNICTNEKLQVLKS